MTTSDIYNKNKGQIKAILSRYRVTNPRIFGSLLHGTEQAINDIDILVDPLPGITLLELGGLQDELETLLGIHVDLVTPGDLPNTFRETVTSQARPI